MGSNGVHLVEYFCLNSMKLLSELYAQWFFNSIVTLEGFIVIILIILISKEDLDPMGLQYYEVMG